MNNIYGTSEVYKLNPKRNFYKVDVKNIYVKDFFVDHLLNIKDYSLPFKEAPYLPQWKMDQGNILIYDACILDDKNWKVIDWEPNCPNFVKDAYKNLTDFLLELDDTAEVEDLLRVHVNYSENSPKMKDMDIHQDHFYFRNVWSGIVYLQGTSGTTNFYDTMVSKKLVKSVEFKTGRCILFPSCYSHLGSIPRDENSRVVLSVMFKLKTKLNDSIPYND